MKFLQFFVLFLLVTVWQVSSQQLGLANLLTTSLANNGATQGLTQNQQQPGIVNVLTTLLASNGTQSGLQQQAGITNLLSTLLSNNEAALALLQTPEVAANIVGLFDYLNTTGNVTGVLNSLSTGTQVSSLTTSLLTLLFESLSLTVFTNNRVSDSCQRDMIIFIEELVTGNPWALRMFDASGKPGSDLADGKTKFVGSYEECIAVNAASYIQDVNGNSRERGSFDGKYCSIVLPISYVPELLNDYGFGYLQLGSCVPNTCSEADVEIFATILERAIFNQTVPLTPTAHCQEGKKDIGSDVIVVMIILTIIGCLVVTGTVSDIFIIQKREEATKTNINDIKISSVHIVDNKASRDIHKGETSHIEAGLFDNSVKTNTVIDSSVTQHRSSRIQRGSVEKIFSAFSIYTNGKKILKAKQDGPLGAINGIRFLSIGWIILGHSIIYSAKFSENYVQFIQKEVLRWTTIGLEYSDVAVDSFFAISGLLVAYNTLKNLEKVRGPKRVNWFVFYIHRYWRLTPTYMLILMIGTVILPFILNGPFWNYEDFPFMGKCRQDWWANLLYINNFYHAEGGKRTCMDWSWYLANDMQFYVISPLLTITLFYFPVVGFILCLMFLLGVFTAAGWIAYNHMYIAQLYAAFLVEVQSADEDYAKNLYFPSYTRMGPYIIGVVTGYCLYRSKCKCKLSKILNLAGWFVSISLTAVILYSRFMNTGDDLFSPLGSAVFQALHRTAWAVAVCWIIFACGTGNGGWINEFLSWKAFVPLSRMTFCAYLINPLVIFSFSTSRMVLTYYTNYEVIYLFLFNITLTFGFAFISSLVFELPMIGLEKILLAKLINT